MDITITPRPLCGNVTAIPSKSQAHRLLICAAFADAPTTLLCPDTNRDIMATVDCLNALGARIRRTDSGYSVVPATQIPKSATLCCCESGSTLRFMLPIAGALGVETTFRMEGRLPNRPLSPLWEEMERMGCTLTRPSADTILCQGKLRSGSYCIDGSVSSQFITGLLFALSLLENCSTLEISGRLESRPYIQMTKIAMAKFGVDAGRLGGQKFHSPGRITVEGDWSNAAFFLAAATLGNSVAVSNLDPDSPQGDRAVSEMLAFLNTDTATLSMADTPDLMPVLAVVAGAKHGAIFTDIRRLRLKESDRVASVTAMLEALGGKVRIGENAFTVLGTGYTGGTVDAQGDHRIAMAAAIAATVCQKPVTILGAEAVNKSYPKFWDEYRKLGGSL